MEILDTVATSELVDQLCRRSSAIVVAFVNTTGESEVTFRLHGDVMTRSGLVETLVAAQQSSIREWMGGEWFSP